MSFLFANLRNQTPDRAFGSTIHKIFLRTYERKMAPKDKPTSKIPPGVVRQIDENLKRIYAPKLTEELPERLQDLLRQLRERDGT